MTDATGGKPATLYEFVDGSVAYFALGTQSWQEAEELQGWALENARRILDERATPGEKANWPQYLNRCLLNRWFQPAHGAGRP